MPPQSGSEQSRPVLLVAEDSPDQIRLLREAFTECGIALSPIFVTEGSDVFAVLSSVGEYAQTPTPEMLILDLGLPETDGHEVLRRIQASDDWQTLPVIVLSDSDDSEIIAECYEFGANAYLTKPLDYDELLTMVTYLAEFWLEQAELPDG